MTDTQSRITLTVKEGVAEVRLNRPDKLNALDHAMYDALIEAGKQLHQEQDLRAVVMSAEGRAFCAGLDMQVMANIAGSATSGARAARTHGIANRSQYVSLVWRQLPVPVFAAVQGAAFGGGLQLALGADVRYVAADAKLSITEINWGLVPDMGGMALTHGLVRSDVLRELIYTGRVVTGVEACELGLATHVVEDPRAAALAAAQSVAHKNPDAVRALKRMMQVVEDQDSAAVLLSESIEQDLLVGSPNQKEAVRANLEKRAPQFQPTVTLPGFHVQQEVSRD